MKNKKAFTVVELVIVIAIIAILAAVLIPTFANIIKKANVSKDQQLIRNLNTALASDKAENGGKNHRNMTEALEAAKKFGYEVGKINASGTDNEILWDSENDVFCFFDSEKGSIEYIPESVADNEKPTVGSPEYWCIITEKNVDKAFTTSNNTATLSCGRGNDTTPKNWSCYLDIVPVGVDTITTATGVDAGETTGLTSINYVNGTAQTVIIRTNGGDLTVNGKNDEVKHYGYAGSVNIVDVKAASYHENGTVQFLEVTAGHIVLEEEAKVTAFHFTVTEGKFENAEGKTISLDISKIAKENLPSFSRDAVTIAPNGTFVARVTGNDGDEYIWLFGYGIKEQMVVVSTDAPIAENGTLKPGITAGCESGSVAEQIANPAKRNGNGDLLDANNQVTTDPAKAVVETLPSKQEIKAAATEFAGGKGTEADPWIVENAEHIRNIGNHSTDSENHFWKVKDGITEIDCNNWVSVDIKGNFDGNNVTLNNLSATLFGTVISETGKANAIKNFTVNAQVILDDWNSVVVYYNAAKNTTYENITVHGYLEGATGVATYIQFGSNNAVINFKDCESDLTIVATSGCACGFIAHPYGATSVNLFNSHYNGRMSTVYNSNNNNCYVNGNYFTGVTFDEKSQRADVQWDGGYNGHYHYLAEGKTSSLTTKTGTLPENIGDVIVTTAEAGASRAVISIIISPNDVNETGCYTQTFITEAAIKNGSFSSDDIKYFNVRVNPEGVIESGIHGSNFDIVGDRWGHTLGGNTFVKVTQYDSLGNVICVTTYNFNDKD